MKPLEAILLSMQLLPLIPPAIEAAETRFGPGHGAQKLAFVIAAVSAALDVSGIVGPKAELYIKLVTGLVNQAVAIYNALGLFRKATPQPAPATAQE